MFFSSIPTHLKASRQLRSSFLQKSIYSSSVATRSQRDSNIFASSWGFSITPFLSPIPFVLLNGAFGNDRRLLSPIFGHSLRPFAWSKHQTISSSIFFSSIPTSFKAFLWERSIAWYLKISGVRLLWVKRLLDISLKFFSFISLLFPFFTSPCNTPPITLSNPSRYLSP